MWQGACPSSDCEGRYLIISSSHPMRRITLKSKMATVGALRAILDNKRRNKRILSGLLQPYAEEETAV